MQAIVLDQKLKSLVASERKITHEILLLIQTLDITQSFRELGYASLFEYLVREIGYSEGSAQRRISSARLMKQVPQIANDLKSGKLNLTQVSLVQVAIRQEEKAQSQKISFEKKTEILEKLKSKSTFEAQKILKDNLPAFEIPKPKAIPAGDDKVHVTLQFSESDWEKVQSLMSHFSHTIPDQKIESLLLYWQAQVEKKKQKQVQKLKSSDVLPPLRRWKQSPGEQARKAQNTRSYISKAIRLQVRQQAKDQCEFTSMVTGRRCEAKQFLEIEHRRPVSKGGTNALENLRVFCRSHNAFEAKVQGVSCYE